MTFISFVFVKKMKTVDRFYIMQLSQSVSHQVSHQPANQSVNLELNQSVNQSFHNLVYNSTINIFILKSYMLIHHNKILYADTS